MLTPGIHLVTVPDRRPGIDSVFPVQEQQRLLATVAHPGVLHQLARHPVKSLYFALGLTGGAAGNHDETGIGIDVSTSQVFGMSVNDPALSATFELGRTRMEALSLALLHELGHHLARQGAFDPIGSNLTARARAGEGVTWQAREGVSEYVAETFTAAVALPQLRPNDPAGFGLMQTLLRMW